jgi:hypothetical protein
MNDYEIGSRVGAISGTEGEPGTIHIFGFGTYVGNEVPSTAGGVFGKAMTEIAEFTPESIPVPDYLKNPKIVLDNGKVVWGCECWWGPEEVIRKRLENYSNIVVVDIDAERAKYAAA